MALLLGAIKERTSASQDSEQLDWSRIGHRWREDINALAKRARDGDWYAVNLLSIRLQDPNREVRLFASDALGLASERGNRRVCDVVVANLGDERPEVREAAFKALGRVSRIGNEESIGLASRGLADRDAKVRVAALEALSSLLVENSSSSCEKVVWAAMRRIQDADLTVAFMAAKFVGRFLKTADHSGINELIGSELIHRERHVRLAGLYALRCYLDMHEGMDVQWITELLTTALQRVTSTIDDFDITLRFSLIEALATIAVRGDKPAVHALSACLVEWATIASSGIEQQIQELCEEMLALFAELAGLCRRHRRTERKINAERRKHSNGEISQKHPLVHINELELKQMGQINARIDSIKWQRRQLLNVATRDWEVACAAVAVLGKLAFNQGWLDALELHQNHQALVGVQNVNAEAAWDNHFVNVVLDCIEIPQARLDAMRGIEAVALGLRREMHGKGMHEGLDDPDFLVTGATRSHEMKTVVLRQTQVNETAKSRAKQFTIRPPMLTAPEPAFEEERYQAGTSEESDQESVDL